LFHGYFTQISIWEKALKYQLNNQEIKMAPTMQKQEVELEFN